MAETSDGNTAAVSTDSIIDLLHSLTGNLGNILSSAKKQADESMDTFVTDGVWSLGASIGLYANFFKSLHVTSRDDFEGIVKSHFRNIEVQDEFEELMETETEWDAFLGVVENYLIKKDKVTNLQVNDPASMDLPLQDGRSGKTVTLKDYSDNNSLLLVLLRHYA